jgi:putative ABC transport system permease protein
VALPVGAVGVANIMVISALECRQKIGLRRALGATKGQIRIQFLAEAMVLTLAGAAAGIFLGTISTAVYAHVEARAIVIPAEAWPRGRHQPRRSGLSTRPASRYWLTVCPGETR